MCGYPCVSVCEGGVCVDVCVGVSSVSDAHVVCVPKEDVVCRERGGLRV